ncbi:LysE family translocator [Streptomyces sp. 8L]|uniref:LysE family translocator n=1 Tax=Streptomyces sp. 8L TaxID=2877242 RepID=UPI001CD78755|nr:LysE family translocator [Streptomyces sp. 8L]MCA1222843.1 LysE family translocator [Streptomyces sp. 8L]
MIASLLSFAGFSTVICVTPGPDLAMVLRNSMCGGQRAGAATALGAAGGSLLWAAVAAAGLAAVLRRSGTAFLGVRLAGASYLVWLGYQSLRNAGESSPSDESENPMTEAAPLTALTGFRQGVLSCLLNPKIGLFFMAASPQFLPGGESAFAFTLLFGLIDCLIAALWLLLVVKCTGRLLQWLKKPRVQQVLEFSTGGVLVLLGGLTAVEALPL